MNLKSTLKSYSLFTLKNTCISFIVFLMVFFSKDVYATHAEGADITYKCLGGNKYELTLSFYRDCEGIKAPTDPIVNCKSGTLGEDFDITLVPIPGTGQEITPICVGETTKCQGGIYPGVQEWIYKGVVTLQAATDWVFSYDLCCRNDAITTIVNPGKQNIHIESTLDNLNFPCNNSPVFTIKPIPFVCVGQFFAFNHGAADADGDYLSYEMITPMNGYGTTVTYLSPYTKNLPISSSPALQFDTTSGSLSMTPTTMEVTIFAVKVKQWKNNRLVGYVVRDIQVRVIDCNNSYPSSNGINGTGAFIAKACVGSPIVFNIYTNDTDTTQALSLNWNKGISGATFTVSTAKHPVGTFSWTPALKDIGTHFFMLTIKDNNCPLNGVMTYAIGIKVSGVNAQTTASDASCGMNNGIATVTPTLGTAPYTYLWSGGQTTSAVNMLPSGTYTATVTDAKGCSVVKVTTIGAGPSTSSITVNATNVLCNNINTGSATANVSGGTAPYTYQWSNGTTAKTATGLAAGTYSVTVKNAFGCTITETVTISQPVLLNTSVSHSDVVCNGTQTGVASATAGGGTAPYSFTWNTGAVAQTVSGLSAGNYFVVVKDANGCSNVQNVKINQPAKVVSSIASSSDITCNGNRNGTATANATGGVAPYSYLWNNGQISQSVSNLNMGTHMVTVSDSLGCTSTVSVTITEPSAIASLMNVNHVKCYGLNDGNVSITVSGGSPSYSYLWSNGKTGTSLNNLPVGSYSVLVTDANGCTKSADVTISQPGILLQNLTNVKNISCYKSGNGSAAVSVVGGIAPYTYLWSNGQVTSAINMLAVGNYSVTATDANGCTVTNTFAISQPSDILLTFSPEKTICPGQSTQLTVSASGGVPPFSYVWSPSTVGQGSQINVNPTVTTTYIHTVTDANGCTKNGNTTLNVYPSAINLSVNSTPGMCVGKTATLSASTSVKNIVSYYWSGNLGNTAGPYIVTPATTTTYSVIVTNSCGITAMAATTIKVDPLPEVKLVPGAGVGCDQVQAKFSNVITPNNGDSYTWDFGDGNTSASTNPTHLFTKTGNYVITVTVTSTYGCISTAKTTFDAAVTPSPDANFTSDPPLNTSIINPAFNFYDKSTNASSWTWDFGDGSAASTLQNPSHKYSQIGTYTVKLITLNKGGCIDSIIKTMEVKPEFTFYIPNTFTPNGDTNNEFFTGKGEAIIEFSMIIFDRWGSQVYETNDINKGWNGWINNGSEIAQEDVYTYKILVKDFEHNSHKYVGNVNIVK